jgi:Rieske Fe-S protein
MKPLSRRAVLKTFCLGAACSNAIGKAWAASVLYDIRPFSHIQTGILRVNLSDFPELTQPLGSVRIGTSGIDARTNRQLGLFAPVIINRAEQGELHVFSAECTHEGCTVRRLEPNSRTMSCPCHGSVFLIDGSVIRGPALQPLRAFQFTIRGDALEIEMPDVFYEIETRRVPTANRIEISFLSFEHLSYEVYFRETLDGALQRVSFATTSTGPLDKTELQVADNFASVFLERPGNFGFFQIAMKVREV